MHSLQHQLNTDHHHLQRLLNCLSEEIDCFDYDSKRSADLTIILNALEYISVYHDKWHHPLEDVIFARLLKKDIKQNEIDLIHQLEKEHKSISGETDKITHLFKMASRDCIIQINELIKSARFFILAQQAHMKNENEYIYPLIDQKITDQDWAEIEKETTPSDDPLFNEQSRSKFDQLYQFILDLENEK